MNIKFVYFGRLTAIVLITIAALFATFYGNISNVSAAPLKTTCPTNPSVPNDDFDCATDVTTLPVVNNVYTDTSIADATQATPYGSNPGPGDDPSVPECNSDSGLETVWYKYDAPGNGEMHADSVGTGYLAVLSVWRGTRGNLTLIACDRKVDGGTSTSLADVRFPVQAGTTYYFEVAQFAAVQFTSLSTQSEVTTTSTNSVVFHVSFRATATTNLAPSVPSLLAPANGAILTTYMPTLDWSTTVLKSGTYFYKYELEVSTTSNFSSPIQLLAPYTNAQTARIFNINDSYFTPFSNLASNTTYYWHVRACNASGPAGQCSAWSATRYFRTAIQPPVLISPSNNFPEQSLRPDFDWQNVTGAGSYNLQISKYINFSPLVLNTNVVASAFTPAADLLSGSTLYWRVRANPAPGNFGPSGWSEVRIFTTPKPPSVPILVSPANGALVTNRQPTLDWNNVVVPSGGAPFDHYEIQIADNPGFTGFNVIIASTTTGDITASNYTPTSPLITNTKYYWKVRSWDNAGNFSSWSAVWTFREAVDPPVLSTPTNGLALNTLRTTFDWNDITGASSYTIQISKASNFSTLILSVNVMASTYTPTVDLPASSTLYWRVRTNGLNGPSIWSYPMPSTWKFTTPNPPSIPALLSPTNNALLTNRQPTLDWKDATAPLGTTFDHYQIQIATDATFASTIVDDVTLSGDITASIYTPSSPLSTNTKYYWRVRSWDNTVPGNYSSWSAVWSFREAIDPPTLFAPDDLSHQTNLRPIFDWDNVTGASGYNIQVSKVDTFATLVLNVSISGGSNSTYTPTANLPGGSQLWWRVRATGANGPSDWSSVWSISTSNGPPLLSAPTNTSVVTTTTPTLSWVVPSLAPGTTFDHYEVQVATDSAFTSPFVDDISIVSASPGQFTNYDYVSPGVPGPLTPDTLYYWRVSFFYTYTDASSTITTYQTAWSSTWSFKVSIPAPTLSAPANGTALDDFTTTFKWNSVTGAGSYNIQISKVPNFSSTVVNTNVSGAGPTITYTSPNLPGGTVYYWRVRANAASGHYGPSGWSTTRSFSTINLPPTPKTPANNSIVTANPPTLTWTVPTLTDGSTLTYFNVEIATSPAFGGTIVDNTTGTLGTPSYTPTSPLATNTVFYWHVQYVYSNGGSHTTAWSTTWSFKTPIAMPVQVSPPSPPDDPTQATPISDLTPTFDWDNGSGGDITGAASYTIQVSTSPTFTTTAINVTVSGNANSSYTPATNLAAGTQYYWRVRANAMSGYFGPSPWSSTWRFTTAP